MRTTNHSIRNQRSAQPVDSGKLLAYEDVVALASRLTERGFTELGGKFMRFAVDHDGLSSLYRVSRHSPNGRQSERDMKDLWAAMPYIVAARVLMRSRNLTKEDVANAQILFGIRQAAYEREQQIVAWESEPPLFMD